MAKEIISKDLLDILACPLVIELPVRFRARLLDSLQYLIGGYPTGGFDRFHAQSLGCFIDIGNV